MIYNENVVPRLEDCGRDGLISLKAILHILENAANHHSLSVADDAVEHGLSGIAWVLSVWDVMILRRPKANEKLSVSTWTRRGKTAESTSARQYIVKDMDGNECVRAAAKYALFDMAANSLVRIMPELAESYKPEDEAAVENPRRIKEPKAYESETEIFVRRADIDFNRHVHNTVYLDYALEAIPKEAYSADDFSEIAVAYRKPLKEGDRVSAKCAETENGYTVGIYNHENALCTLVEFRRKTDEE